MNDFATEEFLTKNIRVRPASGVIPKEEEVEGGAAEEEEDKFNRMVRVDMEEQRKHIKVQRDNFIKEKQ